MNAELLRIGVAGVIPIHWDLGKASEEPGTLTGWASVYNVIDQQDDVVVPGAFKKTLAEWRASKRVIPLTLDHQNSAEGVIGSLVKAEDTAYGLRTTFKFASTDDAQKARTKAREGHLIGLSIWGAIINKAIEMVDDRAVRILKEVGLMFIGLTPAPANTGALVTAAKTGAAAPAGLSDAWVSDMRAALTITSPVAQKVAVDTLVADMYGVAPAAAAGDGAGKEGEPSADGDGGNTQEGEDDAAKFALALIGESGPDGSPPGGEPADPLADLLASMDVKQTSDDLDALAAEIKGATG